LVLFYDQAQRIYSLTATGAIPMHQASWETRSMQTAQIADTKIGVRQWLTFCLASKFPIARSRAKPGRLKHLEPRSSWHRFDSRR
jgi:hypothetical protein